VRGLRLRVRPVPDPVLTPEELDFLAEEMRTILAHVAEQQRAARVSESVIRRRMAAGDVLGKLYQAGAWKPGDRP
jgi:hypothetical protein